MLLVGGTLPLGGGGSPKDWSPKRSIHPSNNIKMNGYSILEIKCTFMDFDNKKRRRRNEEEGEESICGIAMVPFHKNITNRFVRLLRQKQIRTTSYPFSYSNSHAQSRTLWGLLFTKCPVNAGQVMWGRLASWSASDWRSIESRLGWARQTNRLLLSSVGHQARFANTKCHKRGTGDCADWATDESRGGHVP